VTFFLVSNQLIGIPVTRKKEEERHYEMLKFMAAKR
jgi:hypothetical protein